jgi:hypothetical protein
LKESLVLFGLLVQLVFDIDSLLLGNLLESLQTLHIHASVLMNKVDIFFVEFAGLLPLLFMTPFCPRRIVIIAIFLDIVIWHYEVLHLNDSQVSTHLRGVSVLAVVTLVVVLIVFFVC